MVDDVTIANVLYDNAVRRAQASGTDNRDQTVLELSRDVALIDTTPASLDALYATPKNSGEVRGLIENERLSTETFNALIDETIANLHISLQVQAGQSDALSQGDTSLIAASEEDDENSNISSVFSEDVDNVGKGAELVSRSTGGVTQVFRENYTDAQERLGSLLDILL